MTRGVIRFEILPFITLEYHTSPRKWAGGVLTQTSSVGAFTELVELLMASVGRERQRGAASYCINCVSVISQFRIQTDLFDSYKLT
ncbi:unnamed protein product, partial [Iphiclides podalirius]